MRRCLVMTLTFWVGISLVAEGAVQGTRMIDLRHETDLLVTLGYPRGTAGDVNGDGTLDWLFTSQRATPRRFWAGLTWVVFGDPTVRRIDLHHDDVSGFYILGAQTGGGFVRAVAIGDVNDDGLDDLAIGGAESSSNGGGSGTVYIVFGKKDQRPIDLATIGPGSNAGYRIDGPGDGAYAGDEVAALGDINGDGRTDIAISAPGWNRVYVFFTQPSGFSPANLPYELEWWESGLEEPLGDLGFRVRYGGSGEEDPTISRAGDVNGDGIPDFLVGLAFKNVTRGATYVVFGRSDSENVKLEYLGRSGSGFRILGARRPQRSGFAVAGPGDVNGDGFDDVLIGAPYYAPPDGGSLRGNAYVVFGTKKPSNVRLAQLGRRGFEIEEWSEVRRGMQLGIDVAGGGDVNGDGLADLLIGAWKASFEGRFLAGRVFLVYGKKTTSPVNVRHLGNRGFGYGGAWGNAGEKGIYGSPDFNGDGLPEHIITGQMPVRGPDKETAHIVFGRPIK